MSLFTHAVRPFRLVLPVVVCLLFVSSVLAQPPAEAPAPAPETVSVLIGLKQVPNPPGMAQANVRANVQASIRQQGGRVKHSFQVVPAIAAEVPPEAIVNLLNDPAVAVIELDGEFQALAEQVPWGVDKINALKNPGTGDVDYSAGEGIVVAVIDSGIDLDHPDLAANIFVNVAEATGIAGFDDDNNGYVDDVSGWNFVSSNNNPDDDNGHGTHCAGSIGAVGNNNTGVVGVAPRVKLMPLKVLNQNGSGSFSSMIAALDYCVTNGVHITSNSYGSSGNPGSIVQAAYDNAAAAGVLHIAAAGNSGNSSGTGDNVGYPARFNSVVAVASTDINDNRSSFSSTGPAVEMAAPGSSVLSTYRNGGYATLSGTSMACPHVAGAAAAIMSDGVTDIDVVRTALAVTAVDLGASGADNLYGAGRIDAYAARGGSDGGGGDPPPADIAHVQSITYRKASRNRDLIVTIKVVDASNGNASVSGAAVSISLRHVDSGTVYGPVNGTTNSRGQVRFRLRRAAKGTYTTTVNDVNAAPLEWDGETPSNSYQF